MADPLRLGQARSIKAGPTYLIPFYFKFCREEPFEQRIFQCGKYDFCFFVVGMTCKLFSFYRQLTLKNTRSLPVQVDGEPWEEGPCVITLTHHNQALMLARQDKDLVA